MTEGRSNRKRLGELKKGEGGWIVAVLGTEDTHPNEANKIQTSPFQSVGAAGTGEGDTADPIALRLLEMGFLEGVRVDVVHEAPFGGDPLAVKVRGALIALRRNEANRIEVVS